MNKEEATVYLKKLVDELKQVKNCEDINNLMRSTESCNCHIELVGKRRGYEAYAFSQAFNPNKTDYLYSDGASVGRSEYKNLHKILGFKIWSKDGVIKSW